MSLSSDHSSDRPFWDLCAYGVIALYAFFQVLQWPLLPRFLDIYYHLAVVKGFADAGGYVTSAFWEYAPSGRPHLYPPLLHVGMLALYKAGLPLITIGRLVDAASYPVLLFTFYFVLRKIYGKRTSFLALFLFASAYSPMLVSSTRPAFNLAFVLGLCALAPFEKKNSSGAALWLALCFYTHTLTGGLFALSFLLRAVLQKEFRGAAVKTCLTAVVLAAPIFWQQWRYRAFFAFAQVRENRLWEFDPTLLLLAFGTLAWVFRKGVKNQGALPLSLLAGFSPMILTMQPRYFGGHGLAWFSMLAGSGLAHVRFRGDRPAALLLAVWVAFAAPVFQWDSHAHQGRWVWADRSLPHALFSPQNGDLRPNSFSIFFPEDYREIVDQIRGHSGPDDLLWTDFSYTAGILGVLADRATSCGMLAEVRPFEQRDAMQDARLLVWFKNKEGKAAPEMLASVEKNHWTVLQETGMAFILQNPGSSAKRQVPKPLIPTPGLFTLLLLSVSGAVYLSKKAPF
jgi:hypothetical protein